MVDKKVDILAIGVHPDDVELGCGGTLIKHVDLGYTVGILDLTQGELGTRGNAELRIKEAEAAKEYAGIKYRENLGLADGFFLNDTPSKLKLIKAIRKYRPQLVLANAIRDRHPDHGRSAKLIRESCFLSGLTKIDTEYEGQTQEAWRPSRVYHYIQDYRLEPNLVIDITGYLERKFEMIACFSSQFYDPESNEADTPISSKQFLNSLKGRAIDYGRRISVEYGEGFTSESYIGAEDLFKIF